MGWRPGALLLHGFGNARTDIARSAAIFAAVAMSCGLVCVIELNTLAALRAEYQARIDGGLRTLVFTSEAGISISACEHLADLDWVTAAGALQRQDDNISPLDNLSRTPVATVSPGWLALAEVEDSTGRQILEPTVLLGGELARFSGRAQHGTMLLATGEPVQVGAVLPELGKSNAVSGWILATRPAVGEARQCWVETTMDQRTPAHEAAIVSQLGAPLSTAVNEELRLDERSRDLDSEWSRRPTPAVFAMTAGLGAALALILAYMRRSEFALYRGLNMSVANIWTVLAAETFAVVAAAASFGISTGLTLATALSGSLPADAIYATLAAAGAATPFLVFMPTASMLFARNSITEALRDR